MSFIICLCGNIQEQFSLEDSEISQLQGEEH